jgi:hypothetical protein
MPERIWQIIILLATVQALWVAVIDGLLCAGWYFIFISDGEMDVPEAIVVFFLTFAMMGLAMLLTLIWRGFPLTIAICWIGFFVYLIARSIKEHLSPRRSQERGR